MSALPRIALLGLGAAATAVAFLGYVRPDVGPWLQALPFCG